MNPSAQACERTLKSMRELGNETKEAAEKAAGILRDFYQSADGWTGRQMEELLETATNEVYANGLPDHVDAGTIMLVPRVYDQALEILREGREIEEAAAQRLPDQPGMVSSATRRAPEPARTR